MTDEGKLTERRFWPYLVLFLFIAGVFFAHFESAEIKVLYQENIMDPNPKDELYLVHKTFWGWRHRTYDMRFSPEREWEYKTGSGTWWGFNGSKFHDMVEMNLERYELPGDRK